MRPISRNAKRTNIVTANITPQLFEQLQAYTLAHHSTLATTIRDALRNYLDHADTIVQPDNLPSLLTPTNLAQIERTRTVGLTINPKRDPDLRDRLEIYALSNRYTASTIIRRAIYEHTKPATTVLATIDAWGDRAVWK